MNNIKIKNNKNKFIKHKQKYLYNTLPFNTQAKYN